MIVGLVNVGTVSSKLILLPLLGIYLELGLALQMQLELALKLNLTLVLPGLLLEISLLAQLIAQLNIDLSLNITLPSISLDIKASLEIQLAFVVALVIAIKLMISLVVGVDINMFTYVGTNLGQALGTSLAAGWPDGTPPTSQCQAIILAAYADGTVPAGSAASAFILASGSNTYCGQGYERGLCNITVSGSNQSAKFAPVLSNVQIPTSGSQTTGSWCLTGVNVLEAGSGYGTTPPMINVSSTQPILGCTGLGVSPIVLTLSSSQDVTTLMVSGVLGNTAANTFSGTMPTMTTSHTTVPYQESQTITSSSFGGQTTLIITSGTLQTTIVGPTDMSPVGATGYPAWFCSGTSPTQVALYNTFNTSSNTYENPSVGNGDWVSGSGFVTGNGSGGAAYVTMGGGSPAKLQNIFSGLPFPRAGLSAGAVIGFDVAFGLFWDALLDLLGTEPNPGAGTLLAFQAGLEAQLSVGFNFVPPSISASISLLIDLMVRVEAAIAAGITPMPPLLNLSIGLQVQFLLKLMAKIMFALSLVDCTLGVWTYSGTGSGLGPAIMAQFPATLGTCVIMGLTTDAAIGAAGAVFAGL